MKFIKHPAFRGLYRRVLVALDGQETGWSCSFILNKELVETDYFNEAEDALEAAGLVIKEKEGK